MTQLPGDPASGLAHAMVGEVDRPRALVVLLHGYGVDHEDMLSLARRFAEHVPEAVWLAPRAPFGLEDDLSSEQVEAARRARPDLDLRRRRTWVGRPPPGTPAPDPRDGPRALGDGLAALTAPATTALTRLIDARLAELGLADHELLLYGFSQGGMVALHTGLRRARACAGIVSHSGQFFGLPSTASTPRTLMVVGEKEIAGDPWKELFPHSVRCLKRLGVPVEEFVIPGMGHGGSAVSDRVICAFMRNALGLDPIRLGPVRRGETRSGSGRRATP